MSRRHWSWTRTPAIMRTWFTLYLTPSLYTPWSHRQSKARASPILQASAATTYSPPTPSRDQDWAKWGVEPRFYHPAPSVDKVESRVGIFDINWTNSTMIDFHWTFSLNRAYVLSGCFTETHQCWRMPRVHTTFYAQVYSPWTIVGTWSKYDLYQETTRLFSNT